MNACTGSMTACKHRLYSLYTKRMIQEPESPDHHPSWDAAIWRATHKTGARSGAVPKVKRSPGRVRMHGQTRP
eukprot:3618925-Alexandrium_andersonii.AAC.1